MTLPTIDLQPLHALQQTLWEYELQGHALDVQIMEHYRAALRSGTAKGFTFVLLEDESGLLQLVIQPPLYAKLRPLLRQGVLLLVQRGAGTVDVLVGGMGTVGSSVVN